MKMLFLITLTFFMTSAAEAILTHHDETFFFKRFKIDRFEWCIVVEKDYVKK
jgi:hypothetical protein